MPYNLAWPNTLHALSTYHDAIWPYMGKQRAAVSAMASVYLYLYDILICLPLAVEYVVVNFCTGAVCSSVCVGQCAYPQLLPMNTK